MEKQPIRQVNKLYLSTVIFLMFVFPSLSVIIEFYADKSQLLDLTGKWFIFWAIGMRLFTAGLRQAINPSFTAEDIFHIKDRASFVVVRELGFANICLGIMGLLSIFVPQSRIVAAVSGGFFFGIAGATHIIKKPVGPNEWVAMVSDVFIAVVMLMYGILYLAKN